MEKLEYQIKLKLVQLKQKFIYKRAIYIYIYIYIYLSINQKRIGISNIFLTHWHEYDMCTRLLLLY